MIKKDWIHIHEVPYLLVGTLRLPVEPSSRIVLPLIWKAPFIHDKVAYALVSRMGEIPVTFLYPEDNFRWMLRHLDSQDQKVVLQSAQKKPVDTQGRLTVGSMAGQGTNADPVTVMGRGTCLQVVPECVGEFLASRNQENLDNLLNSN